VNTLSCAANFEGTPALATARLSGAAREPGKQPLNIVAIC